MNTFRAATTWELSDAVEAARPGDIIHLELGTLSATLAERGVILRYDREAQRAGIARAAAEGRYKGRKPTAMAKADEVKALLAEGVSKVEIARRLDISERSVYRAVRA